ncbi:MAG TPA: DUF2142 domain-containing protein [Acidimicrobiales bacterium]|nr:DUF2142 domain-containing protein [Acidimicrobiales bacterium]
MSASGRRTDTVGAASGLAAPILVVTFMVTVTAAWIYANPPGYTPDEPAHYTKALGVGRGDWVGKRGQYPVGPGFGPPQLEWINKAARVVVLPAHMAPDFFACSIFQPHESAACLYTAADPPAEPAPRLTYVGSYEPFLYLPSGLVMAQADDALTALALGRTVSGGIALALLVLTVSVLWHPGAGGLALVGLFAAVTPMVLFLASGLAPSGPELAGAICVTAVVWRLGRAEPPSRLVWVALAAGGAVLALSRSTGPFFLAANVAIALLHVGPRRAARVIAGGGRLAAAALAVVVVAVAANVAWGAAVHSRPEVDLASVLSWVGPSFREVPEVLRQDVGQFGWADVSMPRVAYAAWAVLAVGLLVVGLAVARRRERLVLLTVVGGCLVGTVALAAGVIHQTHFPMYGRYALPLWVTVPIGAGEAMLANRTRLAAGLSRAVVTGAAVVAGAVHFVAFWANARRYAVGNNGPVFFLGRSEWSPPGGWKVWVLLVAVGVLCLMLSPLVARYEVPGPVREST